MLYTNDPFYVQQALPSPLFPYPTNHITSLLKQKNSMSHIYPRHRLFAHQIIQHNSKGVLCRRIVKVGRSNSIRILSYFSVGSKVVVVFTTSSVGWFSAACGLPHVHCFGLCPFSSLLLQQAQVNNFQINFNFLLVFNKNRLAFWFCME